MIDDKTERLMWQKIDGSISPEADERLEVQFKRDPQVKAHYDELVRFTRLLGGVHEVEPPPVLRQRILGSLEPERFATGEARETPGVTRKRFAFGLNIRYACVAAASFMLGIITYLIVDYEFIDRRSVDVSNFYGTMNLDNQRGDASLFVIDVPGASGFVSFARLEKDVILSELSITSDRPVQVVIEHGSQSVQFGTVREAGSTNRVTALGGGFRVENEGVGRYQLLYRVDDRARPIRLAVVADGQSLLEQTIYADKIR